MAVPHCPRSHGSGEELETIPKGEYPADTNMNILYCRKSSEAADRQVASIESQKDNLLELAEKSGLTDVKIFIESTSAKEPGRPEFAKMVALIKANPGSTLLVWKLDRLARNPVDEGEIKWLLQIRTIAKIVTPERTYYPEDNSLIASVEFGMATQYIKDLSMNIKRGNRSRLERGGLPGPAPIGYLDNRQTKQKEIDQTKAPLVQQAFELYATGGYSLKQLMATMNDRGLRTKGGLKIAKSKLHRMLQNQFYMGTIQRGGKSYTGSHEQIICTKLFEDVQRVLSGKGRPRPQKHAFHLGGFMSCSQCGCAYTATIKKGHTYYYCTNGKKNCDQHKKYTGEELADELAAKLLKEIQFCEEDIEIAYLAAKEELISETKSSHVKKDELPKRLKTIQQQLLNLAEVISSDPSMANALKPQILILEAQAKAIEAQISDTTVQTPDQALSTLEQTKKAFLQASKASFNYSNGDDAYKSELLKILLWNFSLRDQTVQSYQFKSPYSLMAQSPKKLDSDEWWTGWDSNPRPID